METLRCFETSVAVTSNALRVVQSKLNFSSTAVGTYNLAFRNSSLPILVLYFQFRRFVSLP